MQPWRMLWPKLARGLFGTPLTDPAPAVADGVVQALRERLEAAAQARLGRSLSIRQVDCGSCNGCELEINALRTWSTTSSASACASSPPRAMPMCCW